MFYSQCLLSREGPLGGVWVAAYCHKRLKKDHVNQTDISFSVDKILLEGVPTITYRVLGYLLLGVVRIQSKKVGYLFNDCNEVLINIKKGPLQKKIEARPESLRAPFYSITLPERFELDAFDFDFIEGPSKCNELPHEETMLKDTWKGSKGIQNCFLDEYIAVNLETFSWNDVPSEDALPLHLRDHETRVSPSHTLSESDGNIDLERLRDDKSSHGNIGMDFETFESVEEPMTLVEKSGKEKQTENKIMVSEMELPEIAVDQSKINQNGRDLNTSMEKLHDSSFFGEACYDVEMCPDNEEELSDLVRSSSGNSLDVEQASVPEMTKAKSSKAQNIREKLMLFVNDNVNATPESKFPGASGVATPESMNITTPANKEQPRKTLVRRTPSKRKCLLDREILLPNKVLRENLRDSSSLVCTRSKAPHTVLDFWKAFQIPQLLQVLSEPFTPCISLEFRFHVDTKKLKTEKPVGNAEAPKKLDLPGSPTIGIVSEQAVCAPGTPVQVSATKGPYKSIENLDLPGTSLMGRFPEQTTGCSPTQCLEPTEGPGITLSERASSVMSFERIDKEPSSTSDQEFDLMNEEINSVERDSEELNEWSFKTRTVAMYLQKSFINKKRRGGEGAINMMQVLRRKTKKECVRLFYEILVLKSKELVDVKQENAYADIIVRETPRLEEKLLGWKRNCE